MKINWKKEVYSVSIPKGDEYFQQYSMDNYTYARINGFGMGIQVAVNWNGEN